MEVYENLDSERKKFQSELVRELSYHILHEAPGSSVQMQLTIANWLIDNNIILKKV